MLFNNLWAREDNLGKVTTGNNDLLSWLYIISRNDGSDFASPKLIALIIRKANVVTTEKCYTHTHTLLGLCTYIALNALSTCPSVREKKTQWGHWWVFLA